MQEVLARRTSSLLLGSRQYRKQQRRQNGNDGDDCQQFDQGKRQSLALASVGHTQAILHFAFSFNGQPLTLHT